eukprot:3604043-Pyramimonas_sp.AAC.1
MRVLRALVAILKPLETANLLDALTLVTPSQKISMDPATATAMDTASCVLTGAGCWPTHIEDIKTTGLSTKGVLPKYTETITFLKDIGVAERPPLGTSDTKGLLDQRVDMSESLREGLKEDLKSRLGAALCSFMDK